MSALAMSVRQGTPEWLAARQKGVGSSDAPIIAGERGSVVELWAIKSGLVEPPEPDAEMAVLYEWGHRLEPVIAEWYADHTGRPLRRVNRLLRHPEVEWALASLDRVSAVKGERRIVEIKTERWGWRGDEDVPGFVQAQVQHQLWVTGYDVADVAVLTGGSQPKVYEIPRDDAFIDNLRFLEAEFWGWVTSGTQPPMDGSENARRVLSKLHPRNDGTLIVPNPDIERVFFDWQAAKVVKDHADSEVDTLANTLRALIGDADGIEGLVSWKRSKDSTRVNWPGVAASYRKAVEAAAFIAPEVVEKVLSDGFGTTSLDDIEDIYTATTEGPRVLRSVWKGTTE